MTESFRHEGTVLHHSIGTLKKSLPSTFSFILSKPSLHLAEELPEAEALIDWISSEHEAILYIYIYSGKDQNFINQQNIQTTRGIQHYTNILSLIQQYPNSYELAY